MAVLQSSAATVAVPEVAESGLSIRFQALLALALGLAVIGLAGFSQMDAIHNASHDARHSTAFPCH